MKSFKLHVFAFSLLAFFVGCSSTPLKNSKPWYVGVFESSINTSALSKKLTINCPDESNCKTSLPSISISTNQINRTSSDTANKSLIYTRITYMNNRAFFNEKYKGDARLLETLDKYAASVENCVDLDQKIKGFFIFCEANNGGVLFVSNVFTLPTRKPSEPQLYGSYYIMYLEKK